MLADFGYEDWTVTIRPRTSADAEHGIRAETASAYIDEASLQATFAFDTDLAVDAQIQAEHIVDLIDEAVDPVCDDDDDPSLNDPEDPD